MPCLYCVLLLWVNISDLHLSKKMKVFFFFPKWLELQLHAHLENTVPLEPTDCAVPHVFQFFSFAFEEKFVSSALYFSFCDFLPDIAPVLEGAVQHIASRRIEIGGVDLTKLLAHELGKSNPTVNLNISDVERLKEKYAYCAEDELAYEKIQRLCQREQHTLPDGQVCVFY